MKKTIFMMTMMVIAMAASAQETKSNGNALDKLSFEVKSLYGVKQHGMTPMNLDMQLGFEFAPRWQLVAAAEACRTLMEGDGNRSFAKDVALGGGLAYVWEEGKNSRFDLRLQVLNTIGSPDWSHTTYDIGTNWYGKSSQRRIKPLIGLGFRFQKSHTAGIRDWSGFYATLGFKF